MISANHLKPGSVIKYNNQMHVVVEANHHKPGKGATIIRAKLRNLKTGILTPDTLRPEDMFEDAHLEQRAMQYLYKDDLGYCLMDEKTYEQVHVSKENMGETLDYVKENMVVTASFCDGEIIIVMPPIHVDLKIIETEPGVRGNTVAGGSKPAKLETGKVIRVPLFIETGEVIKVDTRTAEYVERV
ncbi:MAG TPA: elongation factor P [Candidatus Omnitrophota bacterium]|nr:elongation factor P [Candidatus Omnitrophota bacterium]HPS19985.1 elongation factor P [Candidatus Omnitrophota bacterium]